MTTTLNATTSNGLVVTPDNSGTIELQSNGTTELTISSAGAYGQLISGTAQASTSVTSIDFTGIPSWVKRITVMFQGVSTNGSSNYLIRLGTSSGFTTSGYLGTSTVISSGVGSANMSSGFLLNQASQGAGCVFHGMVTIANINLNNWVAMGYCGQSDDARGWTVGGSVGLSATLDRVRITTVNGTDTFDAGSINILYEG